MADDVVLQFLTGLRVYGDNRSITHDGKGHTVIFGPDGDNVAHVRGVPVAEIGPDEAASAIVAACHEDAAAQEALRLGGIGGIYDDFRDLADAITQMATHIKEQDARIEELEARGEGDRLFLASLSEGLSMIGTCGECIHYQAGVCEMRGEPVGEYTLALRRGTDLRTCFEEQHEEGA